MRSPRRRASDRGVPAHGEEDVDRRGLKPRSCAVEESDVRAESVGRPGRAAREGVGLLLEREQVDLGVRSVERRRDLVGAIAPLGREKKRTRPRHGNRGKAPSLATLLDEVLGNGHKGPRPGFGRVTLAREPVTARGDPFALVVMGEVVNEERFEVAVVLVVDKISPVREQLV